MKKLLLMFLFCLLPGLSQAATIIKIDWTYPVDITIAGFRLYNNMVVVCEAAPTLRVTSCPVPNIVIGNNSFTLTAFDALKNESAHSNPFVYVQKLQEPVIVEVKKIMPATPSTAGKLTR